MISLPARAALAALLVSLSACGGGGSFRRPDYAAEAQARCDEADSTSDPSRALALYGLAIEADPKYARAYHGRARVFEATGRGTEAERAYSMAIDVAQDDVRARHLLERAKYLKKRGRIEPAVRDLDRAASLLDAWPDRALIGEARLLRAECRVSLHRWEEARADLDAADQAGLDSNQAARSQEMRMRVDAALAEKKR